ncbi:MAG TPA: phage major capsid protein [Candidatus Dormibacteraeota bacterium]|nr:phage major capsid protein [Candidatus Dormibacteraeota bacterium]
MAQAKLAYIGEMIGATAPDLGSAFVESAAYKGRVKGGVGPTVELNMDPRVALKTTMTTSTAWAPQAIRTDVVIPFATRPIQVIDLLPGGSTSQANVVYMEETTFTSAAAETAENTAYPESALAFTERTSLVQKIPTFIPVTDEQLEDVPQVEDYVNNRLVFMIRQRLDSQILNGNGTPPNLKGLLNVSGLQTQAKASDTAFDAIFKAVIKVRITGRASPSAIVMHPTDWQNLRLTRTAEGIYILGNPGSDVAPYLFGLPVAICDALAQGTALVGDFLNFSQLVYRHGLDVQVGYVNDDFKLGKKSIRADVRVALVAYRGAAFCTVTGL